MDEQLDMDELEKMSSLGGGNPGLYEDIACDTSEAVSSFVWSEGFHPVECADLERFNAQSTGTPGLKVTWRCLGGPDASKDLLDNLMLAGKGAARARICFSCLEMWDRDNDRPLGRYADLLGKRLWIEVETQKREWNGREMEKSVIKFAGFKPWGAFELPEELVGLDDAFEEPEVEEVVEEPKPVKKAGPGTKPPWPSK